MGNNSKDALGDRMKENYENRSKTYLTRRVPVCIRLDGKAFHSFTKHLHKPYDQLFHDSMNATLLYLCKNIQGCKIGYTQSDEITLILTDYDKPTTDAWFDYGVQKMCSIAASMATFAFNQKFAELANKWHASDLWVNHYWEDAVIKYSSALDTCCSKGAMFDARAFNIPEEEICNCLIWRQQDATRNAIQMLGHCHFSEKELYEKSCNEIQDMLFLEKLINFNDMDTEYKRGICCIRKKVPCSSKLCGYKKEWVLDKEIPVFTQDREYILNCFKVEN